MRIGIDIGGSHIGIGLVNEKNGEIIYKDDIEISLVNEENAGDILINSIDELILKLLNKNSISILDVEVIGIASPGLVNNTTIIKATNLNLKNYNIVEKLNKSYKIPIQLRNDAKCAALAEKSYGSLKQYNNAVFITLGTGIGGAVFFNGELLRTKNSDAFEIGHMVIDKSGDKCSCGRNGCFETFASMKKLKADIKNRLDLQNNPTGIELEQILENEKTYAKIEDIVNEYIENLSIGIVNLVNIFEPEAISIGGSFAYYEKHMMNKLIYEIENNQNRFNDTNSIVFKTATYKNDAGIIGATIY